MSSHAQKSISPDIVRQHRQNAASLLTERGADGLLLFRESNILAFCGIRFASTDRLACGLINTNGDMAMVMPAFEASLADGLIPAKNIITWTESDDPYVAIAKAAAQLGIDAGLILLDGYTWIDVHERLALAMRDATLRRDDGVIQQVRLIKSPEEVAALRAACIDTGRFYSFVSRHLAEGLTEMELSEIISEEGRKLGIAVDGALLQSGPSASIPHRPTGQRRITTGDAIIVDIVVEREGYHGDMTRTFAVGNMDAEILRAYQVVRRAQQTAIDAIKPGVTCESIDTIARDIIRDAGLGDYFVHRLGHGIGLDGHEPPYLVQGNHQRLEPGMCVTVEPGVYIPGAFGIRIEDVVVVTNDGCEVLTSSVPTDVSPQFATAAPALVTSA